MKIEIECFDECDLLALKERLKHYLNTLDNGDYKGHIIGDDLEW